MTVVVDNLVRDGFVERVRDKDDRRAVHVHLTPKGRHLFDRIFVRHAAHIEGLLSVLTDAEQRTLGRLLKKLGTTLQAGVNT